MITYINGDVTNLNYPGIKIISHVCNCNNGWGKGFVLALNKKWSKPEEKFRKLFTVLPKNNWRSLLGKTQFVKVEEDIIIANMIAQLGYGKNNFQKHKTIEENEQIPLQYWALEKCLTTVKEKAKSLNASVHAPKFGAGLAGGDWDKIETMINEIFVDEVNKIFIYKL